MRAVNYFHNKTTSETFGWVLNRPNIQTLERKTQQKCVSCQNKLLAKASFQVFFLRVALLSISGHRSPTTDPPTGPPLIYQSRTTDQQHTDKCSIDSSTTDSPAGPLFWVNWILKWFGWIEWGLINYDVIMSFQLWRHHVNTRSLVNSKINN